MVSKIAEITAILPEFDVSFFMQFSEFSMSDEDHGSCR